MLRTYAVILVARHFFLQLKKNRGGEMRKKQTAPFFCATITQHTGTGATGEYHTQTTTYQ
jgi:hypothetical protein